MKSKKVSKKISKTFRLSAQICDILRSYADEFEMTETGIIEQGIEMVIFAELVKRHAFDHPGSKVALIQDRLTKVSDELPPTELVREVFGEDAAKRHDPNLLLTRFDNYD